MVNAINSVQKKLIKETMNNVFNVIIIAKIVLALLIVNVLNAFNLFISIMELAMQKIIVQ
jgi:hypothetical protein